MRAQMPDKVTKESYVISVYSPPQESSNWHEDDAM